MSLNRRVANIIDREALLGPGQSLVVGVSGGPDSLCLLDCLFRLKYRPVVAHFDHQIRAESAEEADFVEQIADSYGVPFELGLGPIVSSNQSREEAARLHRYRFLASVAKKNGITRIAVGHTANDQAETVLMHLIRGAGAYGLRGMLPLTDLGEWVQAEGVSLIRPLLEVWRYESEAYCAEHGLAAINDPSNQDARFFRNRLRNELLPVLQTYNPRVQEVLVRTAKVMAAEAEAIDQLVEERWHDWVRVAGDGVLALQVGALFQAPLALQRAAMRRAILQLAPANRDVGFDTIERLLQYMREGKRLTLLGGLALITLNGETFIKKPGALMPLDGVPQIRSKSAQPLSLPFQVELEAGWRLTGASVELRGDIPRGADEVWFDASEIKDEIELRAPKRGDRMAPIGLSGSVKLSDLFVNRKIPRAARARWPIISCGDEIIWVPRLHRSERGRVTPNTRKIIQMRLMSPSEMVN